jgi:transcriptional regulator with XRE-family HTH domain
VDRDTTREAGQRLRLYIEAHRGGQSFRQLAEDANVRPNTLTSWWSAGTAPDLASLLRVANAMGRPLSALVDAYQGREVEPDTEADLAAAIRMMAYELRAGRAAHDRVEERLRSLEAAAKLRARRGGATPLKRSAPHETAE